jgi:hypothetical protein
MFELLPEISTDGDVMRVETDAGKLRMMAAVMAVCGLFLAILEFVEIVYDDHYRPYVVLMIPFAILGGSYGLLFARRIAKQRSFTVDRKMRAIQRDDGGQTVLFSSIAHLETRNEWVVGRSLDVVLHNGKRMRIGVSRDEGDVELLSNQIARFTGFTQH